MKEDKKMEINLKTTMGCVEICNQGVNVRGDSIEIGGVTYIEPQKVMLGEMTIDEYINRKLEEQVQKLKMY